MNDVPIACSLDAGELSSRTAVVEALAHDALLDRHAVTDGIRVRFRDGPGFESRIQELVAAEARCCPFLRFDLHRADGALALEITGPAEARPIIDEFFAPDGHGR